MQVGDILTASTRTVRMEAHNLRRRHHQAPETLLHKKANDDITFRAGRWAILSGCPAITEAGNGVARRAVSLRPSIIRQPIRTRNSMAAMVCCCGYWLPSRVSGPSLNLPIYPRPNRLTTWLFAPLIGQQRRQSQLLRGF